MHAVYDIALSLVQQITIVFYVFGTNWNWRNVPLINSFPFQTGTMNTHSQQEINQWFQHSNPLPGLQPSNLLPSFHRNETIFDVRDEGWRPQLPDVVLNAWRRTILLLTTGGRQSMQTFGVCICLLQNLINGRFFNENWQVSQTLMADQQEVNCIMRNPFYQPDNPDPDNGAHRVWAPSVLLPHQRPSRDVYCYI